MNYSQEPQMNPQVGGAGSDPAMQSVTIPYFLYEAMARAYYGQARNSDLPVEAPPVKAEESLNLNNVHFNPMDVPSHWKPGGVAAKGLGHVSEPIQTTEEED